MPQINLHDAKTHLSRLVEAAARGAEIVIAKAGKPMARLVPRRPAARRHRKSGGLKVKLWVAEDFDVPMGAEEQSEWTENPIFPSVKSK